MRGRIGSPKTRPTGPSYESSRRLPPLGDNGMTAEQASAELRSLMHDEDKKWFYAFAMGAGCTTEDNGEISMAIRRRDAALRAVVAEHRGGS
jgi:hypothetical protein